GNLIAFPAGGNIPNTSILNYQSSIAALSNGTIVPACVPNCANQITLYANGTSLHVVIDILGYFKPALNGTTGSFEVDDNNDLALRIAPDNTSPQFVVGGANPASTGP